MMQIRRLFPLGASLLLCLAHLPALAADPLADVRKIHLMYQANAEMKDCQSAMTNALAEQKLLVTSTPAQADAVLLLKLDVTPTGSRNSVRWGATLDDHGGKRLYSAFGEESGWTANAACKDLAEDLAEHLMNSIRNARLMRF